MSWRLPLLEVLGHPLGVVLRRVGVDPAPHTGMTEAAQLRAGPLVLARLHDVEPHADLAPGHGVLLMRNCGTKKLWITSCDLRLIRTGLPMGTCISSRNILSSSVPNFPSGPGYVTCQLNCLAVTWITTSVAGIVILIFDQAGTLRNVSTTRISAGTTVQTISSVVLPCV